eukprot:c8505_g1_i2 orf=401-1780(+)
MFLGYKMLGKFTRKALLWLATFLSISLFLLLSITWDFKSSLSRQMSFLHDTFERPVVFGNAGLLDTDEVLLDSIERCEGPLKVYMYDIPRKFNLGMLNRGTNQERPWRDAEVPSWPLRSGLKRQHNVEYWMMLSLLSHKGEPGVDRVVVRVMDPLKADLFFMPFFSSLSFNIHGVNMLDPETEKDRLLQVEVVEFLKKSPWWQRSGGRDHLLVMHHPNAFRFLREQLNTSMFVVADFGRFARGVAWLGKDIVAPYNHMVETYVDDNSTDPFKTRTTLLFFRGQTRRKDEGKVRMKLANLLQNHSRVIYEESSAKNGGIELSTKGMRLSRFCLHPAGDTPSSCRLFDSIVSHCVPVIVSNKIELPFEDELNYQEFCLFFSIEEALTPGYMLSFLERFPKKRWMKMWRKLKLVSHHYEYQHPIKKDDAVSMIWKQARRKIPSVHLAIHRAKRLKIHDWWHW